MRIATGRPHFRDRADAGEALAASLSQFATEPDVVVLGLARGGVPIARHVAAALGAPYGVLVARAIGVPGISEMALAAIAEDGDRVSGEFAAKSIGVPSRIIGRLAARERVELERRAQLYRGGQPLPELRGRTVILVDDSLASGATMRAAVRAVRARRPRRIVAAVPVASRRGVSDVRRVVDELVTLFVLDRFESASLAYQYEPRIGDEEILNLLGRSPHAGLSGGPRSDVLRDVSDRIAPSWPRAVDESAGDERRIEIPVAGGTIAATLGDAGYAAHLNSADSGNRTPGLAILPHRGGQSRDSYRNRYIAGRLRLSGYITLRMDLTLDHAAPSADEASFEFETLAARLSAVCAWAAREGISGAHRTSLIAAGSMAAAALISAARQPKIFGVIARGGRVDLARPALSHVEAPVLLIVGAADSEALQRNREAKRMLPNGALLVRVPGAGPAFDEPGALGAVAEHAVEWLDRLGRRAGRGSTV